MGVATHKLAKIVYGLPRWAEVTVAAEFAVETSVSVSPLAFEWLRSAYGPNTVVDGPGFDADREAVRAGVKFALAHIAVREDEAKAEVVVEEIKFVCTDTTPPDITYAACRAVWEALGVEGAVLPSL